MNTPQALRFPKSGLMIVALILLVVILLAISIPLGGSLLSTLRSPAPMQADSLKMVESFLDLLIS